MSWLEDMAKDVGMKSLRDLAVSMAANPNWPKDDKTLKPKKSPSVETLANRIRELDKGENKEWWYGTKGEPFRLVLALTLKEDPLGLDKLIQKHTGENAGEHSWGFDVFPALRPLDLLHEDLFPGIPPELLVLGGPEKRLTFWHAPKGAGKTLVGHWLSLQYGWAHISGDSWSEVEGELPRSSNIFVELDSVTEVPWEELKQNQRQRICIASPEAHLFPKSHTDYYWERPAKKDPNEEILSVATPPSDEWWMEVLDWCISRLPSNSAFNKAETSRLLQIFPANHFESPGDLLSFFGALNGLGVKVFEYNDTHQIIRAWVESIIKWQRKKCQPGVAEVLTSQAPEILLSMEVNRLRSGLLTRLPDEKWIALIPETSAPPISREKLLEIVDSAGAETDVSKVAKLRTALKPDALAIAEGLKIIGVLSGDYEQIIGPSWIRTFVHREAFEQLFNESRDSIGSLLLHPETSEESIDRLIDELQNGDFKSVSKCLKAPHDSAESLAALDGAFRAVGLARVLGVHIPTELAHKAWETQLSFVRFHPQLNMPLPWFMLTEASKPAALTTRHAWIASALALVFTLSKKQLTHCPEQLNPAKKNKDVLNWLSPRQAPESADESRLNKALYGLGAELYKNVGLILDGERVLTIQEPDVLVAFLQSRESQLTKKQCDDLLALPFGWEAFKDACARQQASEDDLIIKCWTYWGDGRRRSPPFESRIPAMERAKIWRLAPAQSLSDEFLRKLDRNHIDFNTIDFDFDWLTEPIWLRWLECWRNNHKFGEGVNQFWYIPEHLALEAIENGWVKSHDDDHRDLLWSRMPNQLLKLIHSLASEPTQDETDSRLTGLLYCAPDDYSEDLIKCAMSWLNNPEEFPAAAPHALRWLRVIVERRKPGWRAAFEIVRDRMD